VRWCKPGREESPDESVPEGNVSGIPFPGNEYLIRIGRVAYSVSYLEALILNDLAHAPGISDALSAEALAMDPTGRIRDVIERELQNSTDPESKEWLIACVHALSVASRHRNDVLHARPITNSEGEQELLRWDGRKSPPATTAITMEVMLTWLEEIEVAMSEVFRLRPRLS
jgi:hypothetical protein